MTEYIMQRLAPEEREITTQECTEQENVYACIRAYSVQGCGVSYTEKGRTEKLSGRRRTKKEERDRETGQVAKGHRQSWWVCHFQEII